MAEIQVRYPFSNSVVITPAISKFVTDYIKGNGILYNEEGTSISYSTGTANGQYTFTIVPSYVNASFQGFLISIPGCNSNDSYQLKYDLKYKASGIASDTVNIFTDTEFKTEDYSKIPFYNVETSNVSLHAIKSLRNYFMIVKRIKIDDPTLVSFAFICNKYMDGSDNFPVGLYEMSDQTTPITHIYPESDPFQAPNIGFTSSYMLYQYTRDGYIYPDIYYCDGGLSTPPDGVCRIGPSKFLKLGSNFFLKMD